MRVTAFPSPSAGLENGEWWQATTGAQQEGRVSRPRVAGFEERGPFETGALLLSVQPARIDWNFRPAGPSPEDDPRPPTLGSLAAALPPFAHVMSRWLALAPAVQRLAFGCVVRLPATTPGEAYRRLIEFLPSVRIDPDTSSDLFYQINRPRSSRSGIPGLQINRLSKWSVALFQIVRVNVTPAGVQQVMEEHPATACHLELDINTAPSFSGDLPRERLAEIFDELAALGVEIALRGDIS